MSTYLYQHVIATIMPTSAANMQAPMIAASTKQNVRNINITDVSKSDFAKKLVHNYLPHITIREVAGSA